MFFRQDVGEKINAIFRLETRRRFSIQSAIYYVLYRKIRGLLFYRLFPNDLQAIFRILLDEILRLQYNKLMKNEKSKLQKNLTKQLVLSIALTVMFPLGIAMTVVGATRKEEGGAIFTAIMAIGIVFVVLGFYGSPIAWVRYAPQKKYARIIDAIKREGFRDTTEIANHLSMQPNEVIDAVRVCIDKQYLCDYTIEDTKILPLNNRPDDIGTYTVQCPYCGGITQTSNNLQVKCDYCGRMIDVKKK